VHHELATTHGQALVQLLQADVIEAELVAGGLAKHGGLGSAAQAERGAVRIHERQRAFLG
jgi:hypothetical protein